MSRPKLAFDLPTDHLRISRWVDPVLDAVGHDPRSAYVERTGAAVIFEVCECRSEGAG